MAAGLLVVVFLIHGLSPNATPFDSRWSVPIALSILDQGNTELSEYKPLIEHHKFYMIECVSPDGGWKLIKSFAACPDGRLYNFQAIAVPFLATPIIEAMRLAVRVAQPMLAPLADRIPSQVARAFLRGDFIASSALVELLVASFFIALTTVLIYFIAREVTGPPVAAATALIFAFATPAWSIASRGLWQHGPSMMLLSLVLLIALRAGRRPGGLGTGGAALMGAVLALNFFVRSSNAVAAAVFTVFVWRLHRRRLWPFLGAAAGMTLLFALYNQSVYGYPLAPYSWVQREGAAGLSLHPRFLEALAGNLISPGRGLFIYVPFAVLSVWGIVLAPGSAAAHALRRYLVAILLLHWLLISSFEDWIGGHGFGPRYWTDMMPLLVWFLIPVLTRAAELAHSRRWALPAATAVLILLSFGIHFRGATHWACWEWSSKPVDINQAPQRVWQWSDPAFLR